MAHPALSRQPGRRVGVTLINTTLTPSLPSLKCEPSISASVRRQVFQRRLRQLGAGLLVSGALQHEDGGSGCEGETLLFIVPVKQLSFLLPCLSGADCVRSGGNSQVDQSDLLPHSDVQRQESSQLPGQRLAECDTFTGDV